MKWFTLVLSVLCLIVPTVAAAAQTGDEYLEHIYVALNDELTVYHNPELTKFYNSVETDAWLIVDGFHQNDDYDWVAHIFAPERLEGYVAPKELIEVMAVWSDTLNIRKEAGLSARKLRTARRGETVILPDPRTYYTDEHHTPPNKDGYYWRKCAIGDDIGWVADDFLIEKCYFDALEPALEFYDSGELKSMQTYLEELDRNYADIDCEIASDGRSAIAAFKGVGRYGSTTARVYLVGETDKMIYSNYIYDYFISDNNRYTYILYHYVSYGGGNPAKEPYTIFNNHMGEEVFSDSLVPNCLPSTYSPDDRTTPQLWHEVEIVDENHLLEIDQDSYTEVTGEWTGEVYPCLKLIDMTNGEGIVLLEPDWDWLEARGEGISGGVKLRRNSNCSSPSSVIKEAMKTELFRYCEEELVNGFYSEG